MEPTIGRIVLYRLKGDDLRRAELHLLRARLFVVDQLAEGLGRGITEPKGNVDRLEWAGNTLRPGDVLPMVVVRPWHQAGFYTQGQSVLNGHVLLDGPGSLWALSVSEGSVEGTWFWPPRAA